MKVKRECTPVMLSGSGALSKCGACRASKTACNWGSTIPAALNHIKIAIHTAQLEVNPEEPIKSQGIDQGDDVDFRDKAFLKRLSDVTRFAKGQVHARRREVDEEEIQVMVNALRKIRLGE